MGETGKSLVFIHTVTPLVPVFTRLSAQILPGVRVLHILDEPLLVLVRIHGSIQPEDLARMGAHIRTAEGAGADAALVTCSTLSPGVDHLGARIPVFKIDEAMVSQAVGSGARIGVIATNQTTLEPTRSLLELQASREGKSIEVEMVLVPEALPALLEGDGGRHDMLVKEAIIKLAGSVDVVLLAQASTARVLDGVQPGEFGVPVLTSPHTALERIRQYFERT